jgi:glycosyltransferase involved in cell wall biosynthesis
MRVAMIAGNNGSGGLINYIKGIVAADVVPNNWVIRLYCGENLADKIKSIAPRIDVCSTIYCVEKGKDVVIGKQLPDKLISMVDDFGPDVVLYLNGWLRYGLEKYPNVMILHNQLLIDDKQLFRHGINYQLLTLLGFRYRVRKSLREADGVVFLSENSKKQTEEKKIKFKDGRVILVGFEDENRIEKHVLKPLSSPPSFIYVSPLFSYKNHIELVKAFSILKNEGFEFELRLIGQVDKYIFRRLKKLIRQNNMEKNIIFYNHVPHNQIKTLIDESEIFIYASSMEITRYGLLEGMARGSVIISSDRVGLPDMLGKGGVFFDPEKVSSICTAIKTIISDENLRARTSAVALQRSRLFTWEKAATELYNYLKFITREKKK